MEWRTRSDALLSVTRGLATAAVVAGVALGCLYAYVASQLCFESCPPPVSFIAVQSQNAATVLSAYWVIEALAVLMFWWYCMATSQVGRAFNVTGLIVTLGVVGVAALSGFILIERAQFPASPDSSFSTTLLKLWALLWGMALLAAVTAWAYLIARLIWPAGDRSGKR